MSRCHTRIGSIAGIGVRVERGALDVDLRSANSGSHAAIGSVSSNAPSSTEHHRRDRGDRLGHRVDAPERVGLDRQRRPRRRACPHVDRCATLPRRVTTISQPGSCPSSTYRAKCRSIRPSRSASKPTSCASVSTFSSIAMGRIIGASSWRRQSGLLTACVPISGKVPVRPSAARHHGPTEPTTLTP